MNVQNDVYLCFLDYENRVRHEPLIQYLSEINVDGKHIQIINNLTGNKQPECESRMSCQMKYEYNEELDKDVLYLPLFPINIRNIISDILTIFNVDSKINKNSKDMLLTQEMKELSE